MYIHPIYLKKCLKTIIFNLKIIYFKKFTILFIIIITQTKSKTKDIEVVFG